MSEAPTLTLAQLRDAVAGTAVAVRAVNRLMPAGGPHDKVFPPSYLKEKQSTTRYAMEDRRIDGADVRTVLLDSVASQANRMEEALLEAWRRGELRFPLVRVDFTPIEGLDDLQTISALQAPHRIADALLRDSLLGDTPFRASDVGRAITDARPDHATAMYRYCPTALVFGVWDSTGPKGGLGAKFQRALVSEIVGIGAVPGVKTGSRLDPAAIQRSVPIYQHKADPDEWTPNESEAATDKAGKPVPFGRKGDTKGTPATANHGNIPPTIDGEAGGVTIDYGLHTVVLSLPALRRLRFNDTVDGKKLPAGAPRDSAETAARTALAALAIAGVVHQHNRGYDLRSRSLLVPTAPLVLEIVPRDGGEPARRTLTLEAASHLVAEAEAAARELGFGWSAEPVELKPSPKLAQLIRRSRDLAATVGGDDDKDGES